MQADQDTIITRHTSGMPVTIRIGIPGSILQSISDSGLVSIARSIFMADWHFIIIITSAETGQDLVGDPAVRHDIARKLVSHTGARPENG